MLKIKLGIVFIIDCVLGLFFLTLFLGHHYEQIYEAFIFNGSFFLACTSFFLIAMFWKKLLNPITQCLTCIQWAMSVVFMTPILANIFLFFFEQRGFLAELKAGLLMSIVGTVATFIFWLPIGLLNFFALSWIFRNKNVDQKTYNKNLSKVE